MGSQLQEIIEYMQRIDDKRMEIVDHKKLEEHKI